MVDLGIKEIKVTGVGEVPLANRFLKVVLGKKLSKWNFVLSNGIRRNGHDDMAVLNRKNLNWWN